jgi:protein gp37
MVGLYQCKPACDHCYAEAIDGRHTRNPDKHWGKDAPRLISSDAYFMEPLKWNRLATEREQVFCGSMCDIMERRDDLTEPRNRVFELIEQTPNLDWLLLTKRPHEFKNFLPKTWLADPRPNVWLLTTVESADYLWRIEELVKVPAVVHGVSCEPLLGPLTLPDSFLKSSRAWVIAGGESGIRKTVRASHPDWVPLVAGPSRRCWRCFSF